MQNLLLTLIIDGMMALLLSVTLFFCWRLNTRIKILQDNRSELAETIREFDACTRRAAESIAEIHTATQRISENIQHKIDKANFIADDLQFIMERSAKMADKLDPSASSASRGSSSQASAPSSRPATVKREMPNVAGNAAAPESQGKASVTDDPKMGQRVRSRAEQELMNVVKSGKETA
jgi:hypothetical protein